VMDSGDLACRASIALATLLTFHPPKF